MSKAQRERDRAAARRIVEQQKAAAKRRRVTVWTSVAVVAVLVIAGLIGWGVYANQNKTDASSVATPSVAVDDGTAFAIGGDPLLYMITVRNLGPDNASGAHVFDLLPSNLVDATWTCTPSAGAMCSASGNGGIDDHVDMPSGATLVYELTATVLENPESAVDNVVSVTAPSGVTDVNPANNSATDIDATGIFADGFDDAAGEEDGALKDRVRDDSADHRHQK